MNSILNEITRLRKGKPLAIDRKNKNRYRIVTFESDGSKTAYYFSAPIYNNKSKKLIDKTFELQDTIAQLTGSNSKITFLNNIRMTNADGFCTISLANNTFNLINTSIICGKEKISMYRFVSSRNSVELKKAYLKEYDIPKLQRKLDRLMAKYPEIKAVLPDDISAKKLLVGNFKYLTRVYCAFTGYLNGKTNEEQKSIKTAFINGGFKYDSHKKKISNFLVDVANGFEIYNCVYCDIEDVTTFTKANGNKVRKFETEHVLDKGRCPLVGMSLYNFVASCRMLYGFFW